MSTNFRPLRNIRACQLFDGRLEELDVYEHIKPDTTTIKMRCLTDGSNYLWTYIGDDDFLTSFTRYAPNGDPSKILDAVEVAFATYIVSEHQPQYWGFQTQEEWDAAEEKIAKEFEKEFYVQIMKYLRGQPNDIRPGTIGMIKAGIAKKLVEEDPVLLAPKNKDRLLRKIKSKYECDQRESARDRQGANPLE